MYAHNIIAGSLFSSFILRAGKSMSKEEKYTLDHMANTELGLDLKSSSLSSVLYTREGLIIEQLFFFFYI